MRSRKKGFTLIELLVVIAIIAILAAILFPVFAQARSKARQTMCLSNMRQMASAMTMYLNDYDETFPSVWAGGTVAGDGMFIMQTYIKNYGVLWCPDRNTFVQTVLNGQVMTWRLSGYGYNWGWHNPESGVPCANGAANWLGIYCGNGLLHAQEAFNSLGRGRQLAEVVRPASMFAYGDSWDTPRQTLSPRVMWMDEGTGTEGSRARHSLGANFAYVDGHAKWQRVRPYWCSAYYGGGGFGARRYNGFVVDMTQYCYDPDNPACQAPPASCQPVNLP